MPPTGSSAFCAGGTGCDAGLIGSMMVSGSGFSSDPPPEFGEICEKSCVPTSRSTTLVSIVPSPLVDSSGPDAGPDAVRKIGSGGEKPIVGGGRSTSISRVVAGRCGTSCCCTLVSVTSMGGGAMMQIGQLNPFVAVTLVKVAENPLTSTLNSGTDPPSVPAEIAPPVPAVNASATSPSILPDEVKVIFAPAGDSPLPVVSTTMLGIKPEPDDTPMKVSPFWVNAAPFVW